MIKIQFKKINIGQLAKELKYWYKQLCNVKCNFKEVTEARSKVNTIHAQLSQFVTCEDCKHRADSEYDDHFFCIIRSSSYRYTEICNSGDFEPIEAEYTPPQRFQLF